MDIATICYSPFSFSYTMKLLNNQETFPQKKYAQKHLMHCGNGGLRKLLLQNKGARKRMGERGASPHPYP